MNPTENKPLQPKLLPEFEHLALLEYWRTLKRQIKEVEEKLEKNHEELKNYMRNPNERPEQDETSTGL